MSQGKLIFIIGVSGAGKNTMLHLLKERNPQFHEVISYKTRPLRKGEVNGVDYHYLDEDAFRKAIVNNMFLEHAHYALYYYGTKRDDIMQGLASGKVIIKEIEMQGIISISQTDPELFANSLRIFLDLSEETMVKRVTNRAAISPEEVEKRLVSSRWERDKAKEYCNAIIRAEDTVEEVYANVEKAIHTFVSQNK